MIRWNLLLCCFYCNSSQFLPISHYITRFIHPSASHISDNLAFHSAVWYLYYFWHICYSPISLKVYFLVNSIFKFCLSPVLLWWWRWYRRVIWFDGICYYVRLLLLHNLFRCLIVFHSVHSFIHFHSFYISDIPSSTSYS